MLRGYKIEIGIYKIRERLYICVVIIKVEYENYYNRGLNKMFRELERERDL